MLIFESRSDDVHLLASVIFVHLYVHFAASRGVWLWSAPTSDLCSPINTAIVILWSGRASAGQGSLTP